MPGIIRTNDMMGQIPETYAGPDKVWWEPGQTKGAHFLTGDVDADEMIRQAGLDWTVSKRALHYEAPSLGDDEWAQINGLVGLARDTDDTFYGAVSPGYHLFQNAEMGALGEAVLGMGGRAHTAGSLYSGRICWICFEFDREIHVKGDGSPINVYFDLMTGHDGRHGLTAFDASTRAVCGNTLGAAYAGSTGRITLAHRKGMEQRIAEIKRAIGLHTEHVETLEGFLNALAERPMTIEDVKAYTVDLIPTDPEAKNPALTIAKRDLIADLFAKSPTLEGVPFTAYRAYQATVEYVDHGINYRDGKAGDAADRRAEALIDGSGYDLKSVAAKLLIKA